MGKDTFGEDRIIKLIEGWGRVYDEYFEALGKGDEADVWRDKIDKIIKQVCTRKPFIPFEERYPYLPEIKYDKGR